MNIWTIKEKKLVLVAYRPILALPGAVLFLALLLVVLLVETGYVTSVGYDIQHLERTKRNWERDNQLIVAEISSATSLNNIEREAKERLKMAVSESFLYVKVDKSRNSISIAAESPDRSGPLSSRER